MRGTPKAALARIFAERTECEWKAARVEGHECAGRLTAEHAFLYRNSQVYEAWAIAVICEKAHGVGPFMGSGTRKEISRWICLSRATEEEIAEHPKSGWAEEKKRLMKRFGALDYQPLTRKD